MIRRRLVSWLALVVMCLLPVLADAQIPGVTTTAPAATATSASQAAPTTAQLQQLVATLKDDKARAQLVDQLQALIAAQNAEQQQKPASPFAWIKTLPDQIDAVAKEVLAAVPVFLQLPHAVGWVKRQADDPILRAQWIDVFNKLVTIFGAGFAGAFLVFLFSRRLSRRLSHTTRDYWATRILLLVGASVVEALPAIVFAGVVAFVTPLTEPTTGVGGVTQVVAAAALWTWGLVAMARVLLLTPAAQTLYAMSEETCNYLYIWLRRFAYWAAFGYALSTGAWWLGAPAAVVGLLIRVSVLVLAILAIIFVLQNRSAVAQWLRSGDPAATGRWRIARNRLAETWHLLMIVYIIGTFGVFLLNAEGGLALLLRASALSLIVITAAAVLDRLSEHALRSGFAVSAEMKARFPTLEARANRYVPVLAWLISVAIYLFAALALLQAWGLGAFTWLQSTADSRVTGSVLAIAVALTTGILLWELFVSALERYLLHLESDSRRRARAQTLFPLLRLIVLIVLLVVLCFVVLGEIGINLGALFAGAGVFGLIAGFGSQSLLKDFLTSVAVLIDDTFAVGDVIDVGGGHSGVVEAMSIRAVKLRAFDGSLCTIPFSSVTVIQNLSKDYSYYVANIGVGYREDTDRVAQVLIAVADEMRADPAFGALMLAPLEVVGVDRFAESAVILVVRLKTLPIHQWTIGREFNRRLKKAFDREGIEMPFPQRMLHFGNAQDEDISGNAEDDATAETAHRLPVAAAAKPATN